MLRSTAKTDLALLLSFVDESYLTIAPKRVLEELTARS